MARPHKYSTDDLWLKLQTYLENHPNERIVISKLEKETGVTRSIWETNLGEEIKNINEQYEIKDVPKTQGFDLPSVNDMKLKIEQDPKMLDVYLGRLLKISMDHCKYVDSEETIKNLEIEYGNKIRQLELENKELKEIMNNQQRVINKYICDSSDKELREKEGIKDNFTKFSSETWSNYQAMFDDLMK